ncbi:MAG: RICIN domain-containing protein [Nitrospinaceae bacterium]|nr:RICIN domain-containing protein [Nitrospinaceae bacterium]MBT3435537.1 RICIN domain-containing protein [Nitrospinaceae bacterium]MBT3820941.1 RICIN domain-containing protein [Nitrospinaceae bacterium]MBT4094870.1 RICIN domain-containing protein [Nitrospinaceae bacterium]MBT4431779.1 RICIN domain-containing protein [Nitrospinaceae bacterium]
MDIHFDKTFENRRHALFLFAVFFICLFITSKAVAQTPIASKNEVYLKAFYTLDEPRFHCVDIPGHRKRVRVEATLSVHTCKEGIWNLDERFDRGALSKGLLKMSHYGLCVAADTAVDGAKLRLQKCDGAPLQSWRYDNYRLRLDKHPDKCLTIGPEPSRLTPGGRRLPSRHMARSLSLSACSDEAFSRQLWRFESPMRRSGSVMPFK